MLGFNGKLHSMPMELQGMTHQPNNDVGVITPTAALSAFPFTPVESMKFYIFV
jgi:hypothetical protein